MNALDRIDDKVKTIRALAASGDGDCATDGVLLALYVAPLLPLLRELAEAYPLWSKDHGYKTAQRLNRAERALSDALRGDK